MRRTGAVIALAGFCAGIVLALLDGSMSGHLSLMSARHVMRDVGVGAWTVAVLVGIPLWLVGLLVDKRRARARLD